MGLRFRLAVSYVLFFGVFLVIAGFLTRELLVSIIDRELRDVLDEEYTAVKGYMRIENRYPSWSFERYDPEEQEVVERISKGAYMVADRDGIILKTSET